MSSAIWPVAGNAFSSTARRSQMSGLSHFVRTTAPGVPSVPKPPGPLFHPSSAKPGSIQPVAGLVVVYRHVCADFALVGTSVAIFGGGAYSLAAAALIRDS